MKDGQPGSVQFVMSGYCCSLWVCCYGLHSCDTVVVNWYLTLTTCMGYVCAVNGCAGIVMKLVLNSSGHPLAKSRLLTGKV